MRKAIAAALQSDEQTDSEVQFAVLSVDAKGEEKELGVAAVSLEALLAKGADHSLGAVAVKDAKGAEVGKLTLAITALSTLRAIDADVKMAAEMDAGYPEAGTETPASSTPAAAPKPPPPAPPPPEEAAAPARRCRRCAGGLRAAGRPSRRAHDGPRDDQGGSRRARAPRAHRGTPLPTVVLELDFLDPSDKSDAVASPSLAVSADGTVGALDFSHTFSTAPGTATRAARRGARLE